MEMTLAQYAAEKKISLQAVSASFNRHRKELTEKGYYYKKGRATVLTSEGVSYMDAIRRKVVVEVIDDEKETQLKRMQAKIQQLEDENRKLMEKNTKLLEDNSAAIAGYNQTIATKDSQIHALNEELKTAYKDWKTEIQALNDENKQLLALTATQPKKGLFEKIKAILKK